MKNLGLIIGALTIALAILITPYLNTESKSNLGSVRLCTVSESVVSIGNQLATTILSAGTRQWGIVQQPVNATNTVSISIGGTAVSGQGYKLASTTTTIQPSELKFGFATDLPTANAISAITASASSTVIVIECK